MAATKKLKSEISWAVFHPDHVEEARKVIKAFQGDGTIDALGFGVLLEEVSDIFFPGTSTLHTWLRYQIFVPALLHSIQHLKKSNDIRSELLRLEFGLQRTLVNSAEQSKNSTQVLGIIGRNRGEQLKYWPSMVYWNSLNAMQVFGKSKLSRDKVFQLLASEKEDQYQNDDGEGDITVDEIMSIDPQICRIAQDCIFKDISRGILKEKLDFKLSAPEARWFENRTLELYPNSLSAQLLNRQAREIEATKTIFKAAVKKNENLSDLLNAAEQYSRFAQGATYLYNAVLCAHKVRDESVTYNLHQLEKWHQSAKFLENWSAEQIYECLNRFNPTDRDEGLITFCHQVLELLKKKPSKRLILASATLIKEREFQIKGARSRFRNNRVNIPRNVYQTDLPFSSHLFDYRWRVGKSNALSVTERLRS